MHYDGLGVADARRNLDIIRLDLIPAIDSFLWIRQRISDILLKWDLFRLRYIIHTFKEDPESFIFLFLQRAWRELSFSKNILINMIHSLHQHRLNHYFFLQP